MCDEFPICEGCPEYPCEIVKDITEAFYMEEEEEWDEEEEDWEDEEDEEV